VREGGIHLDHTRISHRLAPRWHISCFGVTGKVDFRQLERKTTMSIIDKALGVFPTAAAVQARRLEIIAGNIANASTPQYRARDVDFKKVLADAGDQPRLAVTHPRHIDTPEQLTRDALMFRIPLSPSRDGNTVETHIEEAAYGDAAGRYLAALRFAEGALSGMRKAYRGD
jgi:flagellar basal-body rod protein FlgB